MPLGLAILRVVVKKQGHNVKVFGINNLRIPLAKLKEEVIHVCNIFKKIIYELM